MKNVQDEKEALQTKVDELTRELNDVKGDLMVKKFFTYAEKVLLIY